MEDDGKKTESRKQPRGPRPIDRLGARVEGAEAVSEWARRTASGAALLACLCLLAVLVLAWRLRSSLALRPVAEAGAEAAGAFA
jgi:hypothetical protein